jgi:TPR repeat protein
MALSTYRKLIDRGCVHVLVQFELNSFGKEQKKKKKKKSKASEVVVYGEAHFYLGLMCHDGVGTYQEHQKALHHFKIANFYRIEEVGEYIHILNGSYY